MKVELREFLYGVGGIVVSAPVVIEDIELIDAFQHRGHRLRWSLALFAAVALPLLVPVPAWAQLDFTAGPSVRVTPNAQVEFKWQTFHAWHGQVWIYDNPDGTGSPVIAPRDEDAGGNPVAATQHTIVVNVGGRLATDTGYYFRVTATDPTGVLIPIVTPTPLPPFFTGARAIGAVSAEPGTDSAVISWDANVIGLGRVEYDETGSYGQTVDDAENVTGHSLTLTGLSPATTYYFRACNRHSIDGDCLAAETGSFTTQPLTTVAAEVQAPINADGTSTFNANRGVVPLRFSLALDGSPTCDLPPATLRLTRTGGTSPGPIDESVYTAPSDSGSEFRISECAYHYNVNSKALGPGGYLAEILIDGAAVGQARFELK